jgi:hypothetical protein
VKNSGGLIQIVLIFPTICQFPFNLNQGNRPYCYLKKFCYLRNFESAQCFLVAQVGNLPCRRLAVGRASEAGGASGLPIRDTADRLSALLGLRLAAPGPSVINFPA